MTICIATSNFFPQTGGIATLYGHLADLLNDNGHRVIILTGGMNDGEDEIIQDGNKTIVRLQKNWGAYKSQYNNYFAEGGLDSAGWIATGLSMRDWLKANKEKYAIEIIETGDYGGLGIFMIDAGLPVVITHHGSFSEISRYNFVNEDAQTKLIRELEANSLQHADAIITHSTLQKHSLPNTNSELVHVVTAPWNGNAETAIQPDHGYFFVAGALQIVKGAPVLADALRVCLGKNETVAVQWAGGDSYTAKAGSSVKEFLAATYPDVWMKQFEWQGELAAADVRNKMTAAFAVIVPSLFESFNYAALEAAMMGKAIILTDNCGIAAFFTHEKNALIIPANDADALAAAMIRLKNDPALCQALGEMANEMAKNLFNPQQALSDRLSVYQNTIDKYQYPSTAPDPSTVLSGYIRPGRRLFYSVKKFLKKLTGKK